MTARQMQIAFQDSFERADLDLSITSTELFRELNDAQDVFVGGLYNEFEKSNMVTAALKPLVVRNIDIITNVISETILTGFTIDRATLPEPFRFLIALRANMEFVYGGYSGVTIGGSGIRTINDPDPIRNDSIVRISQQDDIYRLLSDPFNTTTYKEPLALIHGTSFVDIICDDTDFVATGIVLDYIKTPAQISLTGPVACELPAYLHRQIVDIAVTKLLQRLGQSQSVAGGEN